MGFAWLWPGRRAAAISWALLTATRTPRARPALVAVGPAHELPAALLPALIAVQTLSTDDRWVVDARAAGVGAAIVAAWRRAPFPVVILLGAAVTAGLRAAA